MRRGRENQCVSERFERATPIWTRSSSFHTGPRRVNCRTMRPDTRKRLTTCSSLKKALASNGASTHETQDDSIRSNPFRGLQLTSLGKQLAIARKSKTTLARQIEQLLFKA